MHIEKKKRNQASSFHFKKLKFIMELLINKDIYEISIPLLIKNVNLFFNCKNFVKGYHVYMKVWSPFLSKCLLGKKELSNGVDKNAAAVIRLHSCGREEVVGHVHKTFQTWFHCTSLYHIFTIGTSEKCPLYGGVRYDVYAT